MENEVDALCERTMERVGSISTPMMQGDNLAIVLCNAFENPDQEPGDDDDSGWTPDAIAGYEEVTVAIRTHFEPLATALRQLQAENAALKERADALALQADEWEGKYAIVSEQNAALKARVEALEEELRQIEVDAMENYNDFSEWSFPREARDFAFDLAQFCRDALKGTPHAE